MKLFHAITPVFGVGHLVSALGIAAIGGVFAAVNTTLTAVVLICAIILAILLVVRVAALPGIAIAIFAFSPVAYLELPRFTRSFAPATLILGVWGVRMLLRSRATGEGSIVRPSCVALRLILATLVVWMLLLITVGDTRTRSMLWTVAFVLCIALPIFAATAAGSRNDFIPYLLRCWLAVALILGLAACVEYAAGGNPLGQSFVAGSEPLVQKWSVYRVTTTLGHPLMNGLFFATSYAVAFSLYVATRKNMAGLATLAAFAGVVLSSSRTALAAALVATLLVLLLQLRRASSARLVVTGAAVIGAALAAVSFGPLAQRLQSIEGTRSGQQRGTLLEPTLIALRESQYLGYGPGVSEVAIRNVQGPLENSWLQLLLSVGLPGVLLFAGVVCYVCAAAIRVQRTYVVAGMCAFLVGAAGFNVLETNEAVLILPGLLAVCAVAPSTSSRSADARKNCNGEDGPQACTASISR